MNESELEAELRALRPVAPSPALQSRIAVNLAESAKIAPATPTQPVIAGESVLARVLRPLFWTAVGATAAVAVMSSRAAVEKPNQPAAPAEVAAATPAPKPETTRELLGTQQSPIRYEKDRGPVREVRARYLEHVAWTDQRTGGRVEVSIPREDVYLQPIAMQ